jgi:hypothetical protein
MAKSKRIGRPTKTPEPGKKVSLGLKVTADIKNKLDMAARVSGRTQSQEAELRLERSFESGPLMLRRGSYWSPVLITKGSLWVYASDDPLEEQLVELKISPDDLKRFKKAFGGKR